MDHLKPHQLNNKQPRSSFYDSSQPEEYNVSFYANKGGTYVIEIDDEISHVRQFQTAIQVLNMAKEDDEIEIRLSCCPGGSVDAGDTFIYAMKRCDANIRIIASGGVHSMGTHILMEADEFELSNGFNACIHAGSNGTYGTVAEYNTKSQFDLDFRTRQFKEAYEGFLSEKECNEVLAGRDIWLDAQGWVERALARRDYFQNKWESLEKALEKATKKPRVRKAKPVDTTKPLDTTKQPAVE